MRLIVPQYDSNEREEEVRGYSGAQTILQSILKGVLICSQLKEPPLQYYQCRRLLSETFAYALFSSTFGNKDKLRKEMTR